MSFYLGVINCPDSTSYFVCALRALPAWETQGTAGDSFQFVFILFVFKLTYPAINATSAAKVRMYLFISPSELFSQMSFLLNFALREISSLWSC